MDAQGRTVLITGGSAGIGLALARRFVAAGSEVVICGRRDDALRKAAEEAPGLKTFRCDVGDEAERIRLFDHITAEFPAIDVLVNNAGIQVRPPSWAEGVHWKEIRSELAINFEAPVHLCGLFAPFFAARGRGTIVNVTSGLAFVPIASMPTYCATKAAMHSFTMSLRWQLKDRGVKVIEMAPPAVDTDLGGPGLHTFGVPLDEYADFAFGKLLQGDEEFGYGSAEKARSAGREETQRIFEAMNSRQA
jgi:uncharacterized oxidoreductase